MGNLHSTERMKAWSWEDEKHEGRPQGTWNCWERVPRSADPAQTLVPGAGNGPVSGCQVSQECRWSRAFSIISAQWTYRNRVTIHPRFSLKVQCAGKLLSQANWHGWLPFSRAIQNKDHKRMPKLLRIFSFHWFINYYYQLPSLWALQG